MKIRMRYDRGVLFARLMAAEVSLHILQQTLSKDRTQQDAIAGKCKFILHIVAIVWGNIILMTRTFSCHTECISMYLLETKFYVFVLLLLYLQFK